MPDKFLLRLREQHFEVERSLVNPNVGQLTARYTVKVGGRIIHVDDRVAAQINYPKPERLYEYQKARLRLRLALARDLGVGWFELNPHHILRYIGNKELFWDGDFMPAYTGTYHWTCQVPFYLDQVKVKCHTRVFWWAGSLGWSMKVNDGTLREEDAFELVQFLGWRALDNLGYHIGV